MNRLHHCSRLSLAEFADWITERDSGYIGQTPAEECRSVQLIKSIELMYAAATGQPEDQMLAKAHEQFVEDLDPQWKYPMIDVDGGKLLMPGMASLVSRVSIHSTGS